MVTSYDLKTEQAYSGKGRWISQEVNEEGSK